MSTNSLFTPQSLGKIQLRHRLVVAPMTRVSADSNGSVTECMHRYYRAFGDGGFGAIISEGVYTDQAFSQSYNFQPGITDDAQIHSWKELIKYVHETGVKFIVQLMHAGALSQYNRFSKETRRPSAVTPKGTQMTFYRGEGGHPTPTEMTLSEIEAAKQGFVDAAKRAQSAGADGVEILGANGYILDQFLTDYTNQCSDQYGENVTNRIRLTSEVVAAVRAAVGNDFTVGVRISQGKVNDFEHRWAGKDEDAKVIFKTLKESGADYIHTTEFIADAPAFEARPSLAQLASDFSGLPVIANGTLGEPEKAGNMIESGQSAFVTLGKAALAASDWPLRVERGVSLPEFDFEMFSPLADLETQEAYFAARAKPPGKCCVQFVTQQHEGFIGSATDSACL